MQDARNRPVPGVLTSVTVAPAAPANAAGWKNISSAALGCNGSLDRVDFGAKNAGWAAGSFLGPQAKILFVEYFS